VKNAFVCERNETLLASLGIESSAAQYLIAFIVIFALLAGFALVLRKMTGAKTRMTAPERSRNQKPRLGVIDVYDLDPTRQLVLLRRDNIEHLLLIGGPNDVVVESNIVKLAGPRVKPAAEGIEGDLMEDRAHLPEPSMTTMPATPAATSLPPEKKKLGNVARPVLRRDMSVPAAAGAALVGDAVASSYQPEPDLQYTGALPEKLPSDLPSKIDETIKEPLMQETAVQNPSSRFPISTSKEETPASPLKEIPETAAEAVKPLDEKLSENPAQPVDDPVSEEHAKEEQAKESVEQPVDHQSLDAAILSDMAKQLEEALRKPTAEPAPVQVPASILAPPVVPTPPTNRFNNRPVITTRPVFTPEKAEEAVSLPESVAAPPAEPVPQAKNPDGPAPPKIKQAPNVMAKELVKEKAREIIKEPAKESAKEPITEAPKSAAQPATEAKKPDPFSIDEIEAEFARLLGRGPGKTP
jgi:flagellar protein FliO/FliZ